jgi:hypothetical protein
MPGSRPDDCLSLEKLSENNHPNKILRRLGLKGKVDKVFQPAKSGRECLVSYRNHAIGEHPSSRTVSISGHSMIAVPPWTPHNHAVESALLNPFSREP